MGEGGGFIGIKSVAIPCDNDTGQVSSVEREEPHQGDGDIIKDETHWILSAAGLQVKTQRAGCHCRENCMLKLTLSYPPVLHL